MYRWGKYDELSKQYYCIDDRTYDDVVYGIPVSVQFTGIFYNKTVFEEAGITQIPRTIDEFMDVLKTIKENDGCNSFVYGICGTVAAESVGGQHADGGRRCGLSVCVAGS